MDNILYLYKLRENRETTGCFYLERIEQDNYLLIRAGLKQSVLSEICRAYEAWQNISGILNKVKSPEQTNLRKEKKQKVSEAQYRRQLLQFFSYVAEEAIAFVPSPGECFYIIEESLEKTLFGKLWRDYSPFWEMTGEICQRNSWVQEVLAMAPLKEDVVILGYYSEISHFLEVSNKKIRHLRWYLAGVDRRQDTKNQMEEAEEQIEDWEMEYGLATDLRQIEGDYDRIVFESSRPISVLDFTRTSKLQINSLCPGSVVYDFAGKPGLQRLCEDRGGHIGYCSLKNKFALTHLRKMVIIPSLIGADNDLK